MADKYYRIGDAATLLGLKTYVLRFWETEFPELRPVRSGKGQRRYTEADVARLRQIRYLLHEQGLTIEGARRVLSGESALSLDDAASGAQPQSGVQGVPDAGLGMPARSGMPGMPGTGASVSSSDQCVPTPRTTGPVQLALLPLPSLSPAPAPSLSPEAAALPASHESPVFPSPLPPQVCATSPAPTMAFTPMAAPITAPVSSDTSTNVSAHISAETPPNAAMVRVAAELRALQALVRGL